MPQRADDPSIANDEILLRRIRPEWIQHEPDGTIRPGSFAFLDRTPSAELSVHRAALTQHAPARVPQAFPGDTPAAISAVSVRSLGYALVSDPTPDDPSHALVCPSPTRGHARKIAKKAKWVVLRDPQPP